MTFPKNLHNTRSLLLSIDFLEGVGKGAFIHERLLLFAFEMLLGEVNAVFGLFDVVEVVLRGMQVDPDAAFSCRIHILLYIKYRLQGVEKG